mmetsp:Transcript_29604/g.95464  ORF Transcript_29604/g.95464 Transcript_29604/m.95464 type:complete len:402 (+) Transcript_29604:280-1485(+)
MSSWRGAAGRAAGVAGSSRGSRGGRLVSGGGGEPRRVSVGRRGHRVVGGGRGHGADGGELRGAPVSRGDGGGRVARPARRRRGRRGRRGRAQRQRGRGGDAGGDEPRGELVVRGAGPRRQGGGGSSPSRGSAEGGLRVCQRGHVARKANGRLGKGPGPRRESSRRRRGRAVRDAGRRRRKKKKRSSADLFAGSVLASRVRDVFLGDDGPAQVPRPGLRRHAAPRQGGGLPVRRPAKGHDLLVHVDELDDVELAHRRLPRDEGRRPPLRRRPLRPRLVRPRTGDQRHPLRRLRGLLRRRRSESDESENGDGRRPVAVLDVAARPREYGVALRVPYLRVGPGHLRRRRRPRVDVRGHGPEREPVYGESLAPRARREPPEPGPRPRRRRPLRRRPEVPRAGRTR